MNSAPYLEVAFQMVTNRQLRFAVNSQEHAREIIGSINPQKFFSEKDKLPIFGKSSMSSISKDSVAFMVFETVAPLEWAFPLHFKSAHVLTKESFVEAVRSELAGINKLLNSGEAGKPVCFFLELAMQGGVHWYLRLFSETVTNQEKIQIPKMLNDISGFHALGINGGGILINMKNVAAWSLYPGPIQASKVGWKMTPVVQ